MASRKRGREQTNATFTSTGDSPSEDSNESSLEQEERSLEKKLKKEAAAAAAALAANETIVQSTSSNIMQIEEGFGQAPSQKQCGGKDNKEPLSPHAIRIHLGELKKFISEHNKNETVAAQRFELSKVQLRAYLIGYKKMSKNKLQLAVMQQQTLSNLEDDASDEETTLVRFENMICKHSSHNCGQKLFVKFAIVDASDRKNIKEIHSIQSAEFETITKRGVEKQRQKAKMKTLAAANAASNSCESSAETSPIMSANHEDQYQLNEHEQYYDAASLMWNPAAATAMTVNY